MVRVWGLMPGKGGWPKSAVSNTLTTELQLKWVILVQCTTVPGPEKLEFNQGSFHINCCDSDTYFLRLSLTYMRFAGRCSSEVCIEDTRSSVNFRIVFSTESGSTWSGDGSTARNIVLKWKWAQYVKFPSDIKWSLFFQFFYPPISYPPIHFSTYWVST